MSEDVQFNLRIPAELKQQIVEAAKRIVDQLMQKLS